jgi:hypothetical protein
VPVNAEITFLLFKERRPFKLKKEYPSEQWQIISFRLIPLKTPVSFHWTVPLSELLIELLRLMARLITPITKIISAKHE